MNFVDQLSSLSKEASKNLLFNIYLHSRDVAVKLWLVVGLAIDELPYPMLFHLISTNPLSDDFIISIAKFGNSTDKKLLKLMFAPEIVKYRPEKINARIHAMTPEQLKAIAITRCFPTTKQRVKVDGKFFEVFGTFMYWASDFVHCMACHAHYADMHDKVRLHAAIISGDLAWLMRIAEETWFKYTPSILHFAAKARSVTIFQFLAAKGCPYDDDTFAYACMGGSEDIIHQCLRHGCKPSKRALRKAITTGQINVANWLIDTHHVPFDVELVVPSLKYQNFIFLHRGLEHILLPSLRQPVMDNLTYSDLNMPLLVGYLYDDDLANSAANMVAVFATDKGIPTPTKECIVSDLMPVLIAAHDLSYSQYYIPTPDLVDSIDCAAQMADYAHLIFFRAKGWIDSPQCPLNAVINEIQCDEPDMKAIKLLIKRFGSDVNYQDESGCTPLIAAIKANQVQIARFLVKHGADVNLADRKGQTPLMYAVHAEYFPDQIRHLIKHGADINAKDNDGTSVLIHAVKSTGDGIEILIESGVDVNARDENGKTALMEAFAINASSRSVSILINHGADYNAEDNKGRTCLFYIPDDDEMVLEGIDHYNMDYNHADHDGITLLMHSIINQRPHIMSYLMAGPINKSARDKQGHSAKYYADHSPSAIIKEKYRIWKSFEPDEEDYY